MILLAITGVSGTRRDRAFVCGGITAALFAANAAITGEFNYQGG